MIKESTLKYNCSMQKDEVTVDINTISSIYQPVGIGTVGVDT